MISADCTVAELRVLVLAPTGKDAHLTHSVLADAGISCALCVDAGEFVTELRRGIGVGLIAEEALVSDAAAGIHEVLREQDPWSDIPLIVITQPGANSPVAAFALETMGNVSLLERPLRVASLVSAVRAAIRARLRQYDMRAHLLDRERKALELTEADRHKDEFLAMLAHELRNPLAPLRYSLQLLRMSGSENPVVKRAGEVMSRQVDHMVRLVGDLLEISRISRGKIELHLEDVKLEEILENAIESSRPQIDAAKHRLRLDYAEQDVMLRADSVRLVQVFGNLLNNAANYSEDAGQITLRTRVEKGDVIVSVIDQGVGIPRDVLPRVFDMFMQGNRTNSRTRGSGGLGIGLTLVKRLVELHGGQVAAHSEGPGRGSEFVVRLPLLRGTSQPQRENQNRRGGDRERGRSFASPVALTASGRRYGSLE